MEQNISLSYKTRGNTNPRGKSRVYFSYHPEDLVYLEHISELILDRQDCAVYYYDYAANGEPDRVELGRLLDEMQLIVIPVTSKFLFTPNTSFEFELAYAKEKHIPVLPLLQNSDLAEQFNERCGNLQYLDENADDRTAISFDEKLERYLSDVLISAEMTKKIQAAFDAYVFLSYRKKDRKHAQNLMRLIHKNSLCRDIAIWYDEFLVAGEPFDKAIEEALHKSELFALLVTPNLINEKNYVMDVEFPAARESGKEILAAEGLPTDRKVLKEKFAGIPDCVDANDSEKIPAELLAKLKKIATQANNTPEHDFLIGLAYLGGIDVEKNAELAVELITDAAEDGLPEAMKKLADIYYSGVGVSRDIEKAVFWQEKYVDYLKEKCKDNEKLLFRERSLLVDYNIEASRIDEAETMIGENISLAEHLTAHDPARYSSYLVSSYRKAGNFYHDQNRPGKAEEFYLKAVMLLESLAKEDPERYNVDLAQSYNNAARFYFDQNRQGQMEEFVDKAAALLKSLVNKDYERYGGALAQFCNNFGLILNHKLNQMKKETESVPIAIPGFTLATPALFNDEEVWGKLETWYLEIIELCEMLVEGDPERYNSYLIQSFNNAEHFYHYRRLFARAEEFISKAIDLLEKMAKENPEKHNGHLATSYHKAGALYGDDGQREKAEKYFLKAIALFEQLAEDNPAKYNDNLAMSYHTAGAFYGNDGQQKKAEEFYLKAIALFERLAEYNPEKYNDDLVMHYKDVGIFYNSQDQYAKAEEFYLRSIALQKELAERDPERYYSILNSIVSDIVLFYMSHDQYARAEEERLGEIEFWGQLAGCDPERYTVYWADSCQSAGHISYNHYHDPEKAEELYLKAMALYEQLAGADSERYCSKLSESYINAGRFYTDQGQSIKAEEFYLKAVDLYEQLAVIDFEKYIGNLAGIYFNVSFFYSVQGLMAKSEEFFRKARSLKE